MIKKILLGTLLVGLIAVLVFGAVNRTIAKSSGSNGIVADRYAAAMGADTIGGGGNGNHGLGVESHLSDEGGFGGYAAQGEQAWTRGGGGQGRYAVEASGNAQADGLGSRNGRQAGQATANTGQQPDPQAEVAEWLSLNGVVSSVAEDEVIITLEDGTALLIEGRALSFAWEQGMVLSAGDQVRLAAFTEDGAYEIGGIQNLTTGQVTLLREESGRPLWAGRGRGRGLTE